jgi:hypothetical protein
MPPPVQHQQGAHARHGALERLQQGAAASAASAGVVQRGAHAIERAARPRLVAQVLVDDQRLQAHALDVGGQDQAAHSRQNKRLANR